MNFIQITKKHLMKRDEIIDLKSVFHNLKLSIQRKCDQIILN